MKFWNIQKKNELHLNFLVLNKNEMNNAYSKYDVLLHTSILECLPTVLIEASLSKICVFSNDIGATNEILKENYIFPSDFNIEQKAEILISKYINLTISDLNESHDKVFKGFVKNNSLEVFSLL